MQKRGIAPLIATVLIIGFTVALGAGVITWGSSYTKDALEETEVTASSSAACTQIILQIKEITCDASNQIQSLKLINNGIPLEGIIFQIRNNDETKKYQFLDPLSSLEAKTFTEIIPPLQNPTQIKVFAKLGEEVLCDTYIKKDITKKQVIETCLKLKEAGIVPKFSFMAGFPRETRNEVSETLNLMRTLVELNKDTAMVATGQILISVPIRARARRGR